MKSFATETGFVAMVTFLSQSNIFVSAWTYLDSPVRNPRLKKCLEEVILVHVNVYTGALFSADFYRNTKKAFVSYISEVTHTS